MRLETSGIICGSRLHGEHGAIVRMLTPDHGLMVGYVRGSRSRAVRPILIPANEVMAQFSARVADQLPSLTVELMHSRGALLGEPLAAAALDWVTALVAAVLPEAHPYPRLFSALDGVIRAIEAAPSARRWTSALVQFERLILQELGYAESAPLPSPEAHWPDLIESLSQNGRQIEHQLLTGRFADVFAARQRLMSRLERASG